LQALLEATGNAIGDARWMERDVDMKFTDVSEVHKREFVNRFAALSACAFRQGKGAGKPQEHDTMKRTLIIIKKMVKRYCTDDQIRSKEMKPWLIANVFRNMRNIYMMSVGYMPSISTDSILSGKNAQTYVNPNSN
jgi:hypothetical protein